MADTKIPTGHTVLSRLELNEEQIRTLSASTGRQVHGVDVVELSLAESQKLSPALARPAVILMCW